MVLHLEKLYKYTQFQGRTKDDEFCGLYGKAASVTLPGNERIEKAKTEAKKSKVSVKKIIQYTNEFLKNIGMNEVDNPKVMLEPTQVLNTKNGSKIVDIDYDLIKNDAVLPLNNVTHLIWMKFTTDGYLGVVAASNDVNFNENNSSGIIIDSLNKRWDKTFVLIFPLSCISDGLRKDIECGVGNYLSEKGVPILDLYSHRFQ